MRMLPLAILVLFVGCRSSGQDSSNREGSILRASTLAANELSAKEVADPQLIYDLFRTFRTEFVAPDSPGCFLLIGVDRSEQVRSPLSGTILLSSRGLDSIHLELPFDYELLHGSNWLDPEGLDGRIAHDSTISLLSGDVYELTVSFDHASPPHASVWLVWVDDSGKKGRLRERRLLPSSADQTAATDRQEAPAHLFDTPAGPL